MDKRKTHRSRINCDFRRFTQNFASSGISREQSSVYSVIVSLILYALSACGGLLLSAELINRINGLYDVCSDYYTLRVIAESDLIDSQFFVCCVLSDHHHPYEFQFFFLICVRSHLLLNQSIRTAVFCLLYCTYYIHVCTLDFSCYGCTDESWHVQ